MSHIVGISVDTHCNDLGGRYWNPAIRWTRKHNVFVRLEDDRGRIGVGECWCFDRNPQALVTFIRTEVAPHFIGCPLADTETIAATRQRLAVLSARHGILTSALSGFDIATWDLRAQAQALPLWQALNPQGAGKVPVYASGGLYAANKSNAILAREMAQLAERGFRLCKMKIGALPPVDDVARVRAVLATLPPDARLIIDCVYSYDYDTAMQIFSQLPAARIEAIQSPIASHDYASMARLVAAGIPVMANEAEYRPELHRELVARRAVRFLQVAPIACGGISRIRELAALVANTPIKLSLEVSSTAVALMAAAHLAAADGRIAHVEYHTMHQAFFNNLKLTPPDRAGDPYTLPLTAGLGMSLPQDSLTPEFRMSEQQRDPEIPGREPNAINPSTYGDTHYDTHL